MSNLQCPHCSHEFDTPCDSCKGRGWLVIIAVDEEEYWNIERCDRCAVMSDENAKALPEAQALLARMLEERPLKKQTPSNVFSLKLK